MTKALVNKTATATFYPDGRIEIDGFDFDGEGDFVRPSDVVRAVAAILEAEAREAESDPNNVPTPFNGDVDYSTEGGWGKRV